MPNNNTTTTKQIEFYDEELSRTIRQIQEMLANDASNPRLDQLFTTAAAYLQQMQLLTLQIKSKDNKQWKEIIDIRKTTFQHLQQSVHTVEFD